MIFRSEVQRADHHCAIPSRFTGWWRRPKLHPCDLRVFAIQVSQLTTLYAGYYWSRFSKSQLVSNCVLACRQQDRYKTRRWNMNFIKNELLEYWNLLITIAIISVTHYFLKGEIEVNFNSCRNCVQYHPLTFRSGFRERHIWSAHK